MEINDLLKLSKEEIDKLINEYLEEISKRKKRASTLQDIEKIGKYTFEDFISEYAYCTCCGEWVREELKDTEECINGGIGLVCESCYEDAECEAIVENE